MISIDCWFWCWCHYCTCVRRFYSLLYFCIYWMDKEQEKTFRIKKIKKQQNIYIFSFESSCVQFLSRNFNHPFVQEKLGWKRTVVGIRFLAQKPKEVFIGLNKISNRSDCSRWHCRQCEKFIVSWFNDLVVFYFFFHLIHLCYLYAVSMLFSFQTRFFLSFISFHFFHFHSYISPTSVHFSLRNVIVLTYFSSFFVFYCLMFFCCFFLYLFFSNLLISIKVKNNRKTFSDQII